MEAKINYSAEDINKILGNVKDKADKSSLAEQKNELVEQFRGIGENTNAYYDPYIKIADYSNEAEAIAGLNGLDYTNTKYLGHFKFTINGRVIDGTNYPLWVAKGSVLQVIKGAIESSSNSAGFANSSSYGEAFRTRNENGVWSRWTFR